MNFVDFCCILIILKEFPLKSLTILFLRDMSISETNINYCVKLLDEIQCETEGGILMKYNSNTISDVNDHEFIDLAVKYGQKKVHTLSIIEYTGWGLI